MKKILKNIILDKYMSWMGPMGPTPFESKKRPTTISLQIFLLHYLVQIFENTNVQKKN